MKYRFAAISSLPLLLLIGGVASAETFKVSPGGINRVAFESDAPFETITGISTVVSGTFKVDQNDPARSVGRVVVPVSSISTGNATRDAHLREAQWLDAAGNPELVFELGGLELPKQATLTPGASLKGQGNGRITIKGTTRALAVPVHVSYHASNDKLRRLGIKGDVIRIKSTFELSIRDFGIDPPEALAGVKVADKVTITVNLTAVESGSGDRS